MELTPRMKVNAAIARRAAAESFVLLKNDGLLPLADKTKIAVFGIGQIHTVKGGSGSGEVNNLKTTNLLDGLSACPSLVVDELAARAYRAWALEHPMRRQGLFGGENQKNYNDELPVRQLDIEALAAANDAAVIVLSRIAGEGADMVPEKGTLLLTDDEDAMVKAVCQAFPRTLLLLNTPGYLEVAGYLPGLTAAMFIGLPGQEGGHAVADVLTGAVPVSGKLSDTWPLSWRDYANSDTFGRYLPNDNLLTDRRGEHFAQTTAPYTDDIYVGYRYFDTFGKEVLFPFGYGLHYGAPVMTMCSVALEQRDITVTATIENQSETYAAREVVQVYVSAPDGRLEQPYQQLIGYAKTAALQPGASETVTIRFPATALASYDEAAAAYLMEKGTYFIRVGTSSRDTTIAGAIELSEEIRVQQLSNRMGTPPADFQPLRKNGVKPISYPTEAQEKKFAASKALRLSEREIELETVKYADDYISAAAKPGLTLVGVSEGRGTCEELAASMPLEDLCALVCGLGQDFSSFDMSAMTADKDEGSELDVFLAQTREGVEPPRKFEVPGEAGQSPDLWDKYAIPPLVLADGPAGVRLTRDLKQDGEIVGHQYCTAFPVGSLLACAFDGALLEEFGKAVGAEMNEYRVDLWLAPGLNIHRNPLSGRNFEYFSEDPLVSGLCTAAVTKGVQKLGGGVTIKHFAGNEQEFMRCESNDLVTERAMREIYLRGFEIAVRKAAPKAVMTSYNDVNGVPSADNYDLCTAILRDEWGFDGLVMTDWGGGQSTPAISMWAGNDMIQPGGPQVVAALQQAMEAGQPVVSKGLRRVTVTPTRAALERSAVHIMRVALRSEAFRRRK